MARRKGLGWGAGLVIFLSEKIFLGQVLPATVVVESNRIKDVLPGRVEVPGALLNMHRVSKTASTVISVNMPTPHFYRKYAHPFSEGSFLKILW